MTDMRWADHSEMISAKQKQLAFEKYGKEDGWMASFCYLKCELKDVFLTLQLHHPQAFEDIINKIK